MDKDAINQLKEYDWSGKCKRVKKCCGKINYSFPINNKNY